MEIRVLSAIGEIQFEKRGVLPMREEGGVNRE